MSTSGISTVTLRALAGAPLQDERVRATVLSTAHAIAERIGVRIAAIEADDGSVTASIRAGRIEAMGFAAELRRVTDSWYAAKYGEETLWGKVE